MSADTATPLRVVIGSDVDPDRLDFGGIPFNAGRRPQVWNGVAQIGTFRDRLDGITDSRGRAVAVTWCLRCDEQIRTTEGSAAYLLETHPELWKRCERSGDEIGWHPHFWRLESDGATWFHETEDRGFQRAMLRDSFAAFARARGRPPESVRMGWVYHNNETMAEISDLGVLVDFSALPFQKFAGSRDDRGASFAGCFDWSRTGTRPYHPSRRDYQVEGTGEDRLDILELPQGLLESRVAGVLAEARGALRDRSIGRFAKAFARRSAARSTIKACSPTFLFRAMVAGILERGEDLVVTYFHPDELLPDKGQLVNNLIHRGEYFLANMRAVLRQARQANREVEFLTASEAARAVLES